MTNKLTVRRKSSKVTKCQNQNLHFWIFFINFFRNTFLAPFLPYFDTQHFICDKKILHRVPRGPKNIFFLQWYPKIYFGRVFMIFSIKGKISKLFLYWVSQKCCERVWTKLLEKKKHKGINQNFGKVWRFE